MKLSKNKSEVLPSAVKKFTSILTATILVTGCATSGQAVKDHNQLNIFISNKTAKQSAAVISEMSKYCSSNILELEAKDFSVIKKITLDYKTKNGPHYFMRIEVDETGTDQSKITIYHYMDTQVTRKMATQVEQWVNNNSKECVRGF